jgi:hypothetical protein
MRRWKWAPQGRTCRSDRTGATSLALVLHELATNAVKHGALLAAEGLIEIDWSVENGELLLKWEERNGPPLDGPLASKGFGSLLARLAASFPRIGSLRDWLFTCRRPWNGSQCKRGVCAPRCSRGSFARISCSDWPRLGDEPRRWRAARPSSCGAAGSVSEIIDDGERPPAAFISRIRSSVGYHHGEQVLCCERCAKLANRIAERRSYSLMAPT